ncbi:hypothetical protein AX15_003277 [Amanita polypyramis BW_CC]|nr:hypothetical protein AX15_003277 [Amanita polypyramis BW_CC]
MTSAAALLEDVQVLFFDVFGTMSDWRSSLERQLKEVAKKHSIESVDWPQFIFEWRMGYLRETKEISEDGNGPTSTDDLHRRILDRMIDAPGSRWTHLGPLWNEEERKNINLFWHNLDGWTDCVPGLLELKKQFMVVALSNGNMRLLIDMAKHAGFPWDGVLSTELFNSYKPNPVIYQSAAKLLNVPVSKCAMVAAHLFDLRGAKNVGFKTVYVRRPLEHRPKDMDPSPVKSRHDGGFEEVDFVVDSLTELAEVAKGS